MTEKDIEAQIKAMVRASGGWVVKLHADGIQGRGTLDLMGSYRGRPFFVDVKAPGGTVSSMQRYLINRANRTGYVSGVVCSMQQFINLFAGGTYGDRSRLPAVYSDTSKFE